MVTFELQAQSAFWQNPRESMTRLSSPGPSPSAIAGILGCALGFPAVRVKQKAPPYWRVSPELLAWQEAVDCRVACAWTGPRMQIPRFSHSVKLIKKLGESTPALQEQVLIWSPSYLVGVQLQEGEDALAEALRAPRWRVYCGYRDSPAWITNVSLTNREAFWATPCASHFEGTPISRHVVNDAETGERIELAKDFWEYMPRADASLADERHLLRSWVRLPSRA